MLTADYKYYVDWDNDGDFNDEYEDISAYVLSSSWRSGRSNAPPEYDTAGICALSLDNSTSIFSTFNSSSPLYIYGEIRPNLRVCVAMKIGAGEEITMWQGRLESINPIVGEVVGVSTANLIAHGVLAQFNEGETEVPLQQNIKTGAAINALLYQDDFPEEERAINTGLTTISKWWIRRAKIRLQAMRELQDTEHGRLREGKNGKIIFDARDHIFNAPHNDPQATYGTGTLNIWNLRQEDPLNGIYNLVRSQVRTFNVSEDIILVTVSDVPNEMGGTPPSLPPKVGEVPGTRTIWIEYPTPASPMNYIAVDEWTTVDYEANTEADGSGDDITQYVSAEKTAYGPKLKIDFTNNSELVAHLIVLRAHGVAIVEGDPVPVKSENSESQAKYRKREFPQPDPWMTNLDDAQNYCDYILDVYENPRPQLTFDVMANYDSNHLAEIQAREIGDRIRVVAGDAYGLYVDAEFIIDRLIHSVDQARRHIMTVSCTLAPTEQLGEIGTEYDPYVIPEPTVEAEAPKVPNALWIAGLLSSNKIIFACYAKKYNSTVDQAEFRAKLLSPGQSAVYVDLRTPAEGGTLVHNGTTQFVVTGLYASYAGIRHQLFYGANVGRYYFAFRLRNSEGWSDWSDGNEYPEKVKDFVDTEDDKFCDTGPPSGWTVSVKQGPQSGTAVITASRPPTNGKRVWFVCFQLLNTAAGAWKNLDAGVAPSVIRYDGSAIDHSWNPLTGQLTKENGGYGDAAIHGGLLLADKRQEQFQENYCTWGPLSPSQISGNTISGQIALDPDFQPDENGIYHGLRIKIVVPPWEWNSNGYFTSGYQVKEFWDNRTKGDLSSTSFLSDPLVIPAGVSLTNLQGRVWFGTDYCFSHGNIVSPNAVESPYEIDEGVFYIPCTATVTIDCSLGSIFYIDLNQDVLLANFANPKHGRPVIVVARQNVTGGYTMSFGNKYRYGTEITSGVVSLGTASYARNYLGFIYDADADRIDIVAFVSGYLRT